MSLNHIVKMIVADLDMGGIKRDRRRIYENASRTSVVKMKSYFKKNGE